MGRNKYDPAVEDKLKELQVRLDSGVFRSASMDKMERTVDELQSGVDRVLQNINWENLKVETLNDLYKLGMVVTSLSKAQTESEKLKIDISGLYATAIRNMDEEIGRRLAASPELVEQIKQITQEAHDKELAKTIRSRGNK